MEFHRKRRRNDVKTEYVTSLQLYKVPPVETITLQEFEELAEQRLKCTVQCTVVQLCRRIVTTVYQVLNISMCSVLTDIDRINQKSKHAGIHKGDEEYHRQIEAVAKKNMPLSVSTDCVMY